MIDLRAVCFGMTGLRFAAFVLGASGACAAIAQDAPIKESAATNEPADAPEPKSDDKKWSVDEPLVTNSEWLTQHIDTSTVTWLTLDVSRDGRWIAFDCLGDLYMMPIEGSADGSRVVKLTDGLAWDMQPRFSPDGEWIAFTSDRTGKSGKGGENIWKIAVEPGADGEREVVQITDETYRLLNGPNWTPDGNYIVARKHFTSRRSAGAGEMWLYSAEGVDAGGSGGVQMTSKPTDQKDVNEPIFSPDGRYLYYSEDVSPGDEFQYNKDSNGQIYVVQRLDTQTGRTERYITGAGGACRPTPSPDGATIAFVRRFDGHSALHLFDTTSGKVRRIYDDLERDMQEAWAIHGVYPAFAWTPDGKSIVLWARGTIHRIDAQSGQAREIPFRVKDDRRVVKALKCPVDVAPDEFDVKVLQDVAVSPDGSRVAYRAMGHVYVRDLPDGTPTRVAKDDDRFELNPSWSRDGRWLVFCTWNDDTLGTVVARELASGRERVLIKEPGHYVEPVFSPDAKSVVYRRTGGGYLTTPEWSREGGIYRVSASGGAPELITRSGSEPQFANDPGVLYVQRSKYEKEADNRTLVSIDLEGEDRGLERELYSSTWGTQYAVSPEGSWVALVERFNVHLLPMIRAGKTISVGPGGSSVPTRKLTSDAGENVHFSADGRTVYWSLGPTLYVQDVAKAIEIKKKDDAKKDDAKEDAADEDDADESDAELASAEDDASKPVEIAIGFRAKTDVPTGVVALVGGRVVTMRDDPDAEDGVEQIDDAVVIIRGNRIESVGPRASATIPDGAHVIDCTGRVITPGFIDTHAHGGMSAATGIPQQNWVNYARLAFGTTTIHDPSNDSNSIHSSAEMARAGIILSPRTYSTGTILYGASGSFKAEVNSLEDARFHLRRMKAIGAISVKSYNQPRRDQRQQIMQASREQGLMVVPEGGSCFAHNMTEWIDGHTGVEHTLPVERVYDDVLQTLKGTGAGNTPTLVVAYGGLSGENYWYATDDVWKDTRLASYVPPNILNPRARRREVAPEQDWNHIREAQVAKQLYDAGVTIHPGGHGQMNGIDTHWEMWGFVQGGMTPLESLRCGTILAARYLALDNDIGTIEPGKLADVLIFDHTADPTRDIRQTELISYTILNGRVYDARTLDELANHPRARKPLYWEHEQFGGFSMVPPAEAMADAACKGCGHTGAAGVLTP
ncbi:MAG: amidohydrolase family protein [Phycisphaerales bacterium]|jgi:imidazolonepropionase-like amidohydrolase/Tol biopolymer transport system component|nr:amidohydrolase family protein [Phycisphaerales bacterium]